MLTLNTHEYNNVASLLYIVLKEVCPHNYIHDASFDPARCCTCSVTNYVYFTSEHPNTYDCGVFVLEVCSPCLFSYEIVTNKFFLKFF